MRRSIVGVTVLGLIAAFTAAASAAPAEVVKEHGLPAQVELDATAVTCDNTGSTVEFTGTITMDGLSVRISFKNNVKGTHTWVEKAAVNVEVTPAGGTFVVPKQPVLGGVGGNPWISIQFDGDDERIVLGRCVQGLKLAHISKRLLLPAAARALLRAIDCSNKGSAFALSAEHRRGGLKATLYLDNTINKVVHEAETQARVRVSLFPAVVVPKQGSVGGPGGNPLIGVQFLLNGAPAGPEFLLGRCVKLG